MNLIETQTSLCEQIETATEAKTFKNLICNITQLPAIIVEPLSSDLERHGGGSLVSDVHQYGIYIVCEVSKTDFAAGELGAARAMVGEIADQILDIPRVYAVSDKMRYTENVVTVVTGTSRVETNVSMAYFEAEYR